MVWQWSRLPKQKQKEKNEYWYNLPAIAASIQRLEPSLSRILCTG